jgi:membrane peptidoglycan carboxypeptidase
MVKLLKRFFISVGRGVLLPFYLPKSISLKRFLKFIFPLIDSVRLVRLFFVHRRTLIKWTTLVFVAILFTLLIGTYFYVLKDLPNPELLEKKPYPLTTHIRDRNGQELFKFYKSENRTLVKLQDLPQSLKDATISIEDANFYNHSGFSIRGILRAFFSNLNCQLSTDHCQVSLQGGSTITQQLVKTALLSPERTFKRKIKELILAIWVEHIYSKDQILEMYLNRVSYGGSLYGVEEASQSYFGISAKDLSLAQSAFLAGLPASPTTYSPYGAHPELAKSRQAEVLSSMVRNNYLTWEDADSQSSQDIAILPPRNSIKAPHFVMYIRELLSQKYGTDVVDQGGLDVITSLDLDLQNAVQQAVTEETAKVAYLRVGNGAALVTNPQTGEILAMVGSRDYFDIAKDGNVNVTLSSRQPGSSIKPVNYALALTRGFTPASIIEDSPITYRTAGQPPYSPVTMTADIMVASH